MESGVGKDGGDCKADSYSRKDKSLSISSRKFVRLMGTQVNMEVSLDEVARRLHVERRRLYDIVNVFEAIGVMVRKAKSRYVWYGTSRLEETLDLLRRKTNDGILTEGLQKAVQEKSSHLDVTGPLTPSDQGTPPKGDSQAGEDDYLRSLSQQSDFRKEKSLAILCLRFVGLFLTSKDSIVTLEEASIQLMESCTDEEDHSAKLKTKIRRLYDIANILSSLNLLEKVHTPKKKPAFRWLGPSKDQDVQGSLTFDSPKRKRSSTSSTSLDRDDSPCSSEKGKENIPTMSPVQSQESSFSDEAEITPKKKRKLVEKISTDKKTRNKSVLCKSAGNLAGDQVESSPNSYASQRHAPRCFMEDSIPRTQEWLQHLHNTWSAMLVSTMHNMQSFGHSGVLPQSTPPSPPGFPPGLPESYGFPRSIPPSPATFNPYSGQVSKTRGAGVPNGPFHQQGLKDSASMATAMGFPSPPPFMPQMPPFPFLLPFPVPVPAFSEPHQADSPSTRATQRKSAATRMST